MCEVFLTSPPSFFRYTRVQTSSWQTFSGFRLCSVYGQSTSYLCVLHHPGAFPHGVSVPFFKSRLCLTVHLFGTFVTRVVFPTGKHRSVYNILR